MATPNYWLMKSEPNEYSIEQLKQDKHTWWDGIRNHQAKGFMAKMQPKDLALFYHSSCKVPGIVGMMEVISKAEEDPEALNPKSDYADNKAIASGNNPWLRVKVAFKAELEIISRNELKQAACFLHSPLIKQSRLSIMPINKSQWQWVLKRSGF